MSSTPDGWPPNRWTWCLAVKHPNRLWWAEAEPFDFGTAVCAHVPELSAKLEKLDGPLLRVTVAIAPKLHVVATLPIPRNDDHGVVITIIRRGDVLDVVLGDGADGRSETVRLPSG